MKTYNLSALVTISLFTEVEANSEAEAIEIASECGLCSLSDPCMHGDSPSEVWVHSGEIDGEPTKIEVEK